MPRTPAFPQSARAAAATFPAAQATAACLFAVGCTAAVAPISVQARVIDFSGYQWEVRNGNGLGPGPNDWSSSTQSVWVDANDDLHLKLRNQGGDWLAAAVTNTTALGYGRYEWRTQTDPEPFDPNVIVGLFVYENDTQEIDIEFGRFGNPQAPHAQYAVQPSYVNGNYHDFDMQLTEGSYSTHIFDWRPEEIRFMSLYGHYSASPPGTLIQSWTYTGPDIPVPSGETARMNLWLFQGNAPADGMEREFVFDSFSFTPIPEPATLVTLGPAALAAMRRRNARR